MSLLLLFPSASSAAPEDKVFALSGTWSETITTTADTSGADTGTGADAGAVAAAIVTVQFGGWREWDRNTCPPSESPTVEASAIGATFATWADGVTFPLGGAAGAESWNGADTFASRNDIPTLADSASLAEIATSGIPIDQAGAWADVFTAGADVPATESIIGTEVFTVGIPDAADAGAWTDAGAAGGGAMGDDGDEWEDVGVTGIVASVDGLIVFVGAGDNLADAAELGEWVESLEFAVDASGTDAAVWVDDGYADQDVLAADDWTAGDEFAPVAEILAADAGEAHDCGITERATFGGAILE